MEYSTEIAPHEREVLAHCYRMLGSLQDAEDALQEVRLRAWRARDGFEGRSSARTWLHTIAVNVCLTELERRERRVLPVADAPLEDPAHEPVWMEPFPDDPEATATERESVELAFVAALQHLPGNQRAALILCEVLGFSAPEAAEALETSAAAVNSALQRARRLLGERLPERSQQATLRALGDDRVETLTLRYADALSRGDLPALLELIAEDATWSMPPQPAFYTGHRDIAAFLRDGPMTQRWRHRPLTVNGQPALACFMWVEDEQAFVAYAVDVLTLSADGRIASVTAFLDRELFDRLGIERALR